jgi:hypothetical protein
VDRLVLDEVTAALEELVGVLDREDDLQVILEEMSEQVIMVVPDADAAGVSIMRDGRLETVAHTDPIVLDVEREQRRCGAGPGAEAASTGNLVCADRVESERRWPEFAGAAAAIGITGYLSAPMMIDAEFVGSLNLYSRCGSSFADTDAALLELFTTAAGGGAAQCTALLRRPAVGRAVARGTGVALRDRSGQGHPDGGPRVVRRGGFHRADQAVTAGEHQGPRPRRALRREGHQVGHRQQVARGVLTARWCSSPSLRRSDGCGAHRGASYARAASRTGR